MSKTSHIEDRVSLLLGMGFEREPGPGRTAVARAGRGSFRIDSVRPSMGTRVAITALGRSATRLEEAVGRAFQELDRLIPLFSRHQDDSALSTLNDAGRLIRPPRELGGLLDRARRFHTLTRGAFDVSVAPLVDLFRDRLAGPVPAAPTEAEIAEVRESVGARHIQHSGRTLRLLRPGMRLTLDGIAKGYIVDRMAHTLESGGVHDYLIDGGGDLRTAGRNADRRPWTVGLRDPLDPSSLLDTVQPDAGAVATSGSYEHFYDADRRFHHLVDADTGLSPGHVASVTVRAPTAMAADALATSAFIMGPAAGLDLVDAQTGCACLILDHSGQRLYSRGWRSAPPEPDPME